MKKRSTLLFFCAFAIVLCFMAGVVKATVYYVKTTGTVDADGESWATASSDLQAMIDKAAAGDEIWVAAGTYTPSAFPASGTTDPRDVTFLIKSGVKIYGGFTDGETIFSNRNPVANVTVLSGDLGANGKAYHVLVASNNSEVCVLDGFTVRDGAANGSGNLSINGSNFARTQAGAMYVVNSAVEISKTVFLNNLSSASGGAIYTASGGKNLDMDDVVFNNNTSGGNGGAVYLSNTSSYSVVNSKFYNNTASNNGGAFFSNPGSDNKGEILNVVFSENTSNYTSATTGGGALYLNNGTVDIIGVTFYKNYAKRDGGAIFTQNGNAPVANIYNSIFYENISDQTTPDIRKGGLATVTIKNSLTQIYSTGENIVVGTTEQIFLSTDAENPDFLRLNIATANTNPAIDEGSNSLVPSNILTDLAGNVRICNGIVDMGAYEVQQNCTQPVDIVDFAVKAQGGSVAVTWETSAETNNDYFLIERSKDGIVFTELSRIFSKGNEGALYSYTDFSPLAGTNYYRLIQVDKDGTSNIKGYKSIVVFDGNTSVKFYPNPVIGGQLNIDFGGMSYTKLQITDAFGKTLENITVNSSDTIQPVDMSLYVPGIYYVKLSGTDGEVTQKIIK